MKNLNFHHQLGGVVLVLTLFFVPFDTEAQITQVENLFGKYALSVDGCENNNGSGQAGSCAITINKPAGATLFKAYMVTSQTPFTTNAFPFTTPLRVNTANTYTGSIGPILPTLASTLSASLFFRTRYGDVTADLTGMLNALPAGGNSLYLMPDASQVNDALGLEGRTLLVIWNDPNGTDRVISIALGATTSLPPTTFTVNTPPLDLSSPGSAAIAGLGINFSIGMSNQINNVLVNNNIITTFAGGFDDGDVSNGMVNGNLFTIGDDADALGAATEKYDITGSLVTGSTSYSVTFRNVSAHAEDYLSVYYSVVSGAFQQGAIIGTLYNDVNRNFVFDAGEPALPANITVNLYRDIDGVPGLNTATDQLVNTTITNSSGEYIFPTVTVGSNYILQVNTGDPDIPSGFVIETVNPVLSVESLNADTSTIDFGFVPPCLPAAFASDSIFICSNQTYQLPSGTIVNSQAVYIDTIRNPASCDSIITTISLFVNNTSASNVTDSIFQGQTYTLPSGILVNDAGIYQTTLTNSLGCDSIITTTLTLKAAVVTTDCLVLTNAFTPNGDGINDYWVLSRANCLRKLAVDVYNRYGSPVYHSDDYQNDWYGTYKSKPLPDGTYYYVIRVINSQGNTQIFRNNVTIIR